MLAIELVQPGGKTPDPVLTAAVSSAAIARDSSR